jgi:hypothetical protein
MWKSDRAKEEIPPMFNQFLRIIRRIRRVLANRGIAKSLQNFETYKSEKENSETISILIVASGSVLIPPTGWGAVETIISETIPVFLQNNIDVSLLNSESYFQWRNAKRRKYDVILCHSDTHMNRIRRNWKSVPIIAITHYGLAALPEHWHKSYKKAFYSLSLADAIGCLSPAIYRKFLTLQRNVKLVGVLNGTSFQSNPEYKDTTKFLVLGKVESRKRQYELWHYGKKRNIEIHFIGQIEDIRVKKILIEKPESQDSFLGPRSRSELSRLMPQYSCLILDSEGEADALVLYEAQIAGLEIITNSASLGNQDSSLAWIHVIENEDDLEIATKKIKDNPIDPFLISKYADENYRWETRILPLIGEIRDLAAHG